MKYIKTFEEKGVPTKYKFKIGVRVDTIIKSVKNEIFKIIARYKSDKNTTNNYQLQTIGTVINIQKIHWEYECNLIPVSKEEVKLLKNINKYNL